MGSNLFDGIHENLPHELWRIGGALGAHRTGASIKGLMLVPDRSLDAPVVLVIPADAQFLHILRTLTACVASMLDIPYDTLEDQRLAVAEAANFLLGRAPASSTLTLRLWPRLDELVVSLEADDLGPPAEDRDAMTGFSWNIIQRLTDAVEQTELDGRHLVTMRWTTLQHRTA